MPFYSHAAVWKSIKTTWEEGKKIQPRSENTPPRYFRAQKGPKPQTNKVNKQTTCAAQCGSDHDRTPTVKHRTTGPCVSKKARVKLRVSKYKDILRYSLLSPEEQPNLKKTMFLKWSRQRRLQRCNIWRRWNR